MKLVLFDHGEKYTVIIPSSDAPLWVLAEAGLIQKVEE